MRKKMHIMFAFLQCHVHDERKNNRNHNYKLQPVDENMQRNVTKWNVTMAAIPSFKKMVEKMRELWKLSGVCII